MTLIELDTMLADVVTAHPRLARELERRGLDYCCYQGLADLEGDTHLHVHKENNLLFLAVVRLEHELAGKTGASAATAVPSARPQA